MAGKAVLIIEEDLALVAFDAPSMPEAMSAAKVMEGLTGSAAWLEAAGHAASLPLTRDAETVEEQIGRALAGRSYDVIVIGAGLRTLPPLAGQFERLMNMIHQLAPHAKLAFNSRPDDADAAALRWL